MSKIYLGDNTVIEEYCRPYIIAEVNSSHNGNIEVAKEMIDAAVAANCNCVKFQSWSSATLYSKSYYNENPIAKRFVERFSLSNSELKDLSEYCSGKNIAFSSTPYSEEEVDFLVEECKVPFIKIASMEINNLSFLSYIAQKDIPIIMSTGMSSFDEVKKAVETIELSGNKKIAILHCVSLYPTPLDVVNLNNIIGLRQMFQDYPIGFSDHTIGEVAAVGAVVLGAAIIEKHITLDSNKIGMDNQMAMEPGDLKSFVKKCEDACSSVGFKKRIISKEEEKQKNNMRRSIVTTKDLRAGHRLEREDLTAKRPGSGIDPQNINNLIGKVINKDIKADILVVYSDLQ